MTTKRAIVWIGSLIFGAAITAIVIFPRITVIPSIELGPLTLALTLGFGTTVEKFAYSNTLLLFLAMGGIAFIWLDYFLKTEYLKK